MWYAVPVVVCVILCVCLQASAVGESLSEFKRDSLDLNGRWQCLLEGGEREIWKPAVAAAEKEWRGIRVPGQFSGRLGVSRDGLKDVVNVWARRGFTLTAEQARRGGALKWGGVRFGATVWINGRKVGSHPVMGPHTILLPAGALKAGRNVLLMKIPGWAGVPRSKSGYPLIPTGGGTQPWGQKAPAIYDDIWLDFYDRAYMTRILALPDVGKGTVTFRVWLASGDELPEGIQLGVTVRPGGAKATTAAAAGKAYTELTVALRDVKSWTPDSPHLYTAELTARAGRKLCDRAVIRFGMRQIETRRGHYTLNGKPLWFRGSNLMCEWLRRGSRGMDNRKVKEYLVDEARLMNFNCFRTHTLPPNARWLEVADAHGIMIWAELPVLYNFRNFKFTRPELDVFHKHALLDSAGWVTKLWNHPSVALWVLSNESPNDAAWESGPFYRHVRRLDPTRLCLRSGGPGGTPDVYDVHTCGNYGGPAEGSVLARLARFAAEKDPRRPLSNSEYMNMFKTRSQYAQRWLGKPDASIERQAHAEFAAEHTEAMRRLRYDGILPYMYAWFSGLRRRRPWRKDYPTRAAAAFHSSMAPVLTSLDLFDRNFVAGAEVTTPAAIINELHQDIDAALDVYVTPRNPLFVPDEAALAAAVSHQRIKLTIKADSFRRREIRWEVPASEGVYYLAAVVRRDGARPVVSQRTVRAIDPAVTTKDLTRPKVVLLGAGPAAEKWLKARDIPFVKSLKTGKVAGDVLVVWDVSKVAPAARSAAKAIRKFAAGGRRVVVLASAGWDWPELVPLDLSPHLSSRAFPYAGAKHPVLANVNPEFLKRLNGRPGAVAEHFIAGPATKGATKLLWMAEPERPVMLSVPVGKGEILITTLNLRSRLPRGSRTYDPAAERVLLNLICR